MLPHFMPLWMSKLEANVVSQLKGATVVKFTRIPPVETTFWSRFYKVQTRPHQKSCEILRPIVRLLKGADRLILLRLRVSHNVPVTKSWSGCGRMVLLLRGLLAFATPQEDRYMLMMVRAISFLSSPRLRAQIIRRTGRCLSVRTIARCLLVVGYHSCRPDFSTSSAPLSVLMFVYREQVIITVHLLSNGQDFTMVA